ncbi:MAG: tetratricopeptide repeat protein, partial [Bacteroidetes bacterium]|nr:tetratricopeptide repeat protein [Bacteroidota bacterium]
RRKYQYLLTGSVFFIATIIIYIQYYPIGSTYVCERYVYIPYIGIYFVISSIAVYSFRSLSKRRPLKYLLVASAGLYLLFFGISTYQRNKDWKDTLTLNTDLSEKLPGQYPLQGIGLAYEDMGNYPAAIEYYHKSVKFLPSADAYLGLATCNASLGNTDSAFFYYEKALEFVPDNTEVYLDRGFLKQSLKDYEGAIEDYSVALRFNNNYARLYYHRGNAKFLNRDTTGACEDWEKAVEYGMRSVNRLKNYFCKNK